MGKSIIYSIILYIPNIQLSLALNPFIGNVDIPAYIHTYVKSINLNYIRIFMYAFESFTFTHDTLRFVLKLTTVR